MPRLARKALILLEVLVCFGPVSLVLLLGIAMLPMWIAMLFPGSSGAPMPPSADGEQWDLIWPSVVVVFGMFGLLGLTGVLAIVLGEGFNPLGRILTLALVSVGIAGIAIFNVVMVWSAISGDISVADIPALVPALLVYTLLPGFGAAHLLYLARDTLFPGTRGVNSQKKQKAPTNAA